MELDEQLTNAVNESLQEAFSMMLGIDLESSVFEGQISESDLICSVGFVGGIEGNVSISLALKSACTIVGKMLEMEISEMSADVADGMSEVANLAVGGVKSRMTSTPHNFEISIPNVIEGNGLKMNAADGVQRISRYFCKDDISFLVNFDYKVREENEQGKESKFSDKKINASDQLSQLINRTNTPID